jgi:nitroreductase
MSSPVSSSKTSLSKPADSPADLHPFVRDRWSPRAFSDQSVSVSDLHTLLEAARWAPSSTNYQPWRFIVARKEDQAAFQKILHVLVEGNQGWAKQAPVLVLAVAKKTWDNGSVNPWAFHDVGLALGTFVFQASALGLSVHMMGGFDPDQAQREFHIPEDYRAITAVAVGYPGDPATLPEKLHQREIAPRTRKPLAEIAFTDDWGRAFSSED